MELAGEAAVDIDMQLRGIGHLLQVHIDRTRHFRQLLAQLLGDAQVLRLIAARSGDLDVDGGRQTEIEHLRHHVRRLEVDHQLGKALGEAAAQGAHISGGRSMSGIERDQHLAIR